MLEYGCASNVHVLTGEEPCDRVCVTDPDTQEMWVVAAVIVSTIDGRGKSRLAQAEMLGVFVPGASQGS
ncbi:hypothetical protein BRE01_00880 [Brevibacillus reuszeri]|uniref:Uncharacterized protein n=1 Tax=Brevibacillus reuszeri TaxID=54915 RepID=A0A0K9YRP4_9BACL|nr:hypothetical protein ADS79_21270 [Brevibacillus reuszeri]GED66386.1 hypothetical protein BRE01_00880 [Brevibacillus reuszeri]